MKKTMKKILILPLLALLFSCSTDDTAINMQNDATSSIVYSADREVATLAVLSSCFDLTATVSVDVSNGLGNPYVVFTSSVNATVTATRKFKVKVEVQELSDCDNMNSDIGSKVIWGPASSLTNVNASPPVVTVQGSKLPLCYKWRFVFEGVSETGRELICVSYSPWYESPLY